MLLKLLLGTILLGMVSLQPGHHQPEAKRITVVGLAEDDKDRAAVTVEHGGYYLIDGLDEWDEKYAGKCVEVTGILVSEYHAKQSTDSMPVQERVGTWRILKKAKWRLAR